VTGRLDVVLNEMSAAPRDVIRAVLSAQGTNPVRALRYIRELEQWVKREDWEVILDNFARCVRITRSEKMTYDIRPELFVDELEGTLYAAYQQVAKQLTMESGIDAFLSAFAPIVPTIQAFFDKILVHAEDEALRQNRLGLLQAISGLQKGRADLSKLSGF
jgi:glycyl-tRNA synthetase beta subunit